MTTLKRSSQCWRPLNINGRDIAHFYFYKDGQITMKSSSGWLEREKYPSDTLEIIVNDCRKANKINLARNDNFYVKSDSQYISDRGRVDLYIYDDNIITNLGEFVKYDEDYQTGYKTKYRVNLRTLFNDGKWIDDKFVYSELWVDSFECEESMRWEDKTNRPELERIQAKLQTVLGTDRICLGNIKGFLTQFKEI